MNVTENLHEARAKVKVAEETSNLSTLEDNDRK